jgi:hypothetical protein
MNADRWTSKFWAGLEDDAKKRAAELTKYAGTTTAGPLSRISPQLRARMQLDEEPTRPLVPTDNAQNLDYAKSRVALQRRKCHHSRDAADARRASDCRPEFREANSRAGERHPAQSPDVAAERLLE